MKLTHQEELRIRRISLAVSLFSFTAIFLFLIFKKIITPNPLLIGPGTMEISIGAGSGDPETVPEKQTLSFSSAKKATSVPNDEQMALQKPADEPNDHHKPNTVSSDTHSEEAEHTTPAEIPGTTPPGFLGYDLSERTLLTTPRLPTDTKEEGKVVVDIVVDRDGTVVEADPNGRGTTTSSAHLKAKARQMAMATKFSASRGQMEQRGSIVINFSFN